ncbi:MAG TPA: SufE family protein [Thermodesulfobacteriota bacterium]|nr:SufE family protein [Thermodesulfobacteriota bacterium]
MSKLEEIIEEFQALDFQYTLETLLNYAESLPELPEQYKEARDAGFNRVPECQTPVYLWVGVKDGRVQIHADVAEEAPTVRGFVAILVDAFNGATPEEVEAAPNDILYRLGLDQKLGMMRMQGLSAVYGRIKNEVKIANTMNFVSTSSPPA